MRHRCGDRFARSAPLLLEGLRQLSCLRAEGKLVNLTQRFEASGAPGQCGIGHTRWATHGKPEERNAHPHLDGLARLQEVPPGASP